MNNKVLCVVVVARYSLKKGTVGPNLSLSEKIYHFSTQPIILTQKQKTVHPTVMSP